MNEIFDDRVIDFSFSFFFFIFGIGIIYILL